MPQKRTPGSLCPWGSTESLPLNLGFWLGGGGIGGWACRLVGLIQTKLGLLPLKHKLRLVTGSNLVRWSIGGRHCHTGDEPVPIIPLLQGRAYGPEDIKVMSTAFDGALNALGLMDRADPLNELVAKKIIEIAKTGERNPSRLRDRALKSLQS